MKCPACDVVVAFRTTCSVCGRSEQERAQWLVAKWRADGSFPQSQLQPNETVVERTRKLLLSRSRERRANWLELPTVEDTAREIDRILLENGISFDEDAEA